jgi:hypothetical protein
MGSEAARGNAVRELAPYMAMGSAFIPLLLGSLHLLYTFHGPKLLPRDPELRDRMRLVSPVITRETTMWKCWLGFNASHSLGLMLFGLVYGYLALLHPTFLFESPFMLVVGLVLLVGYAFLCLRYWFRVPRYGVLVSVILYAVALLSAVPFSAGEAGISNPVAPNHLNLFGQFVGDWDVDSVITQRDGAKIANKGEWHFRWILDGSAIQDMFRLYASDGKPTSPPSSYGTTVRVYNAQENLWHVAYVSSTAGTVRTFEARPVAGEIIMDSKDRAPLYRWVFSHVARDSFRWRSEGSPDGGTTWVVNQEMTVRRRR